MESPGSGAAGSSAGRKYPETRRHVLSRRGVRLLLAEPAYCGDNAAMIAGLAGAGQGISGAAALEIDVSPNEPVAPCPAG